MLEFGWGLTQYAPLVIYIISLIVIVLSVVYRVEIGIVYYVFFLPLQNLLCWAQIYPYGYNLNDFLLVAMLIGWGLRRSKFGESKVPFIMPLLILLLWTLFGLWNGTNYVGKEAIFSLNNRLFIQWKNYLIPYILFFIVAYNIKTRKQIVWVVGAMLLAMLFLDRNVYNVLHYRDLSHYSEDLSYNSVGTALSGNYLAMFLAQYAIIFASLFLLDKNKWFKVVYAVVVVASYYCVMFLFSRGAYIATFMSIFWIGLLKNRKIVAVMLIFVGFWNFLLPNAVQERIEMTKSHGGYDDTTMERIYIWDKAEQMISEHPITGAGFFVTSQLTIRIDDNKFQNYKWKSFHNNYLQTIVELGIIGLLIVLWLYALCFIKGWQLYRMAEDGFIKGLALGFMGCTLAILAGNFTGTTWQFYNISGYYWVLCALVVRSIDNIRSNRIPEKGILQGNNKPKTFIGKENQIFLRRKHFRKDKTI